MVIQSNQEFSFVLRYYNSFPVLLQFKGGPMSGYYPPLQLLICDESNSTKKNQAQQAERQLRVGGIRRKRRKANKEKRLKTIRSIHLLLPAKMFESSNPV
jgi:hypothetical protein